MKKSLLQNTIKLYDTVEIGLCLAIYEICNDILFEYRTPLEFAVMLNMQDPAQKIEVKPFQKLRVGYMAKVIKEKISPQRVAEEWHNMFLEKCGIKPNYFSRHQSDFCGETGSEDNKEFVEDLQDAVRGWQPRNNRPN